MKIIIAVFFYLLHLSVSELEPLSKGLASIRYSISSCVLSAAKEFMNESIITVSITTKDSTNYTKSVVVLDQILLSLFHEQSKWTILVQRSDKPKLHSKFFKNSDEYIIQIRDVDEFENILLSLMRTSSWNPHAKFIVITTTIFNKPIEKVEYIFEKLWNQLVLNAIIMLPTVKNTSLLTIYSWFPYRDGHCGDNFDKAFVINKCIHGEFEKANRSLFPEKIPLNMNNCPIKIRAVIWPPYVMESRKWIRTSKDDVNLTKGIEVLLMNTIAQAAKFRIIYSVSDLKQDWGVLQKNGTATGMMKAILTGEANIGIGAIATLTTRHLFFDSSISYFWESVTWCIPHAMPIPKWKSLVNIFNPYAWSFILFAYLTVTLSIWGLSNLDKHESTSYKRPQSCFQNMLSMILGLTVKILPRVTRIRMIIILWVIASLHLNAAFTSSLIRELTEPSFDKQIKSVREMKERGFSFGLVPPTPRFFKFEGKSYYSEISSWDNCNDVKLCLDRTAYKRDYAVGIPRMYMQYASHKYITTRGQLLLYWTKEDIVAYPVEMIMTKGFPLLKRINNLISRIKEAGLISKWQYDFMEKADNTTIPINYVNERNDDIMLTEQHLEGAFILLIIGMTIATLVFICELVFYRRKVKKLKSVDNFQSNSPFCDQN